MLARMLGPRRSTTSKVETSTIGFNLSLSSYVIPKLSECEWTKIAVSIILKVDDRHPVPLSDACSQNAATLYP